MRYRPRWCALLVWAVALPGGCSLDVTVPDARPGDAPAPGEGALPDAGTSGWSVRIQSTQGDEAACRADEYAVGGGATCDKTWPILVTPKGFPKTGKTTMSWQAGCGAGTPLTTYVVCVKVPLVGHEPTVVKEATTTTSVTAPCTGAGVVGGGCLCESTLQRSYPEGEGWACECANPPSVSLYNDAFALCVPDAAAQALELEHRTAPATCSPGKQALGGGCVGPVTESRPEETGWTCDNKATAHVICGAASRHQ